MRIYLENDPDRWVISDLNPLEWLFLSRLPSTAAGEGMAHDSRLRLFPDPLTNTPGVEPDELVEEWKEYVVPDLANQFQEARETVAQDLVSRTETRVISLVGPGGEEDEEDDDSAEAGIAADDLPDEDFVQYVEELFDEEDFKDDEPADENLESDSADGTSATRNELEIKTVSLPLDHGELWYSALNQARILMNECWSIASTLENFASTGQPPEDPARWLQMAQYEFYSVIQNFLLSHVMKP
ncbi:MAG: hypothetical protein R3F31_08510 [Verrucomicrobiales bacterium]|nr:hypothetical protein [Verrucomicrobiae bacterium]MCP5555879.1 hypothetical protein [Akkermansiaceae bacterium]HRX56926.1 hypothetical protein [Verrucomicrobiales bacterium]